MACAAGASEVDIVILSIERTEDTLAAVASAAAQEGVNLRIFLVDQGSGRVHLEAMAGACEKDTRLLLHRLPGNLGVPGGRNAGAALGTAPFICFLDNDALFADRDILARALARIRARPELGAIALRVILADSGEDQNQHWLHPGVVWRGNLDASVEVARFIGAGCLLRRDAFAAVGGFDPAFFFMEEERDLAYRLLNGGWRIHCFADLKVLHKASLEHRKGWGDHRFFYLVRNDLYGRYKRGSSFPVLLPRAAAHLVRGIGAGLASVALGAIASGLALCLHYRWSTPGSERRKNRLGRSVRQRIAELEGRGRNWPRRLAAAFTPLPQSRN